MDTAIIFSAPDLGTRKTLSPRRFWKELLYEGTFYKEDSKGKKRKIPVTRDDIDHFTQESNRFLSNGNKIYVPVEHTDDPEANRGYVISVKSRFNEKKERHSFWGLVEFRDDEAAKMAMSTDMSVFIPDVWADGNGEEYDRALVHSALTVSPVVPDLHGFKAIVASLTKPKRKRAMAVELEEILDDLGMEVDGEVTAEMIRDHVLSEQELDDDNEFDNDNEFDDEEFDDEEFDDEEFDDEESDDEEFDDEEPRNRRRRKSKKPAFSKREKVLLSKNRTMSIDALSLSKPKRDSLKRKWCSDKAITKALKSEDAEDAFESLMLSLTDSSKNDRKKRRVSRRSPGNDDGDDAVNPVIADAKARAEARRK